jgi:hypothetical protein
VLFRSMVVESLQPVDVGADKWLEHLMIILRLPF